MRERVLNRLAEGIRGVSHNVVREEVREAQRGVIRTVSPLRVELTQARLVLEQEDLIVSQSVRRYDYDFGLAVGDTLVLTPVAGEEWVASAVIAVRDNLSTLSMVPSNAAAGTPSLRKLGTGATDAAAGNDSRLSDARTPTAHKTTHEPGGSDPLTLLDNTSIKAAAGILASKLAGFPSDASKVLAGDGSWPGGMATLFDTTLGSNSLAIDTGAGGVAQTHAHLLVLYVLRTNVAASGASIGTRFNNDSGNNYIGAQFDWNGTPTNPTAHSVVAGNAGRVGRCTGSTAPANSFGIGLVFIPFYRGTGTTMLAFGLSGTDETGAVAGMIGEIDHTRWNNTAAISRIAFGNDFSAVSLVTGSRITIYGLG